MTQPSSSLSLCGDHPSGYSEGGLQGYMAVVISDPPAHPTPGGWGEGQKKQGESEGTVHWAPGTEGPGGIDCQAQETCFMPASFPPPLPLYCPSLQRLADSASLAPPRADSLVWCQAVNRVPR